MDIVPSLRGERDKVDLSDPAAVIARPVRMAVESGAEEFSKEGKGDVCRGCNGPSPFSWEHDTARAGEMYGRVIGEGNQDERVSEAGLGECHVGGEGTTEEGDGRHS